MENTITLLPNHDPNAAVSRHALRLDLNLNAANPEAMADALRELADQVEQQQAGKQSISAGYQYSWVYTFNDRLMEGESSASFKPDKVAIGMDAKRVEAQKSLLENDNDNARYPKCYDCNVFLDVKNLVRLNKKSILIRCHKCQEVYKHTR